MSDSPITLVSLAEQHRVAGDETATAVAVLRALKVPEKAIPVLVAATQHYIYLTETRTDRSIRRQASPRPHRPQPRTAPSFRPRPGAPAEPEHFKLTITLTGAFLSSKFKTGRGGEEVTWGEASTTQIMARKRTLTSHRDNVEFSIEQCDAAIAQIEAVPGATCLNDVARRAAA